jgi:mannose-6-phosphate isomerase-like protein (cupin superfamily)
MNLSRRGFAAVLPALIAGSHLAATQQGQAEAHLPSGVYLFADLPVRSTANLEYRPIMEGQTVDACHFSVHESSLAPNNEPHPPHHHKGEEMFLILDGTLEVTINGTASRVTRGSVAFIGSGDEHGIRNVGEKPAKYYVIELGPQK